MANNDISIGWSVDENMRFDINYVTRTDRYSYGTGKSLFERYMIATRVDKANGNADQMDALAGPFKSVDDFSPTEIAEFYGAVEAAYVLKGAEDSGAPKTTTRLDKTQSGSTTSELSVMALYAGTQVTFKGVEIIPMIKFVSMAKNLDKTILTAAGSDDTEFGLDSGKESALTLSVKASKQIGKGVASFTTAITDTTGTDIMYTIGAGSTVTVFDNPTEKIGMSYGIGYSFPVRDDFSADISYNYYKNGDDITNTTYISFVYEF